MFSHPRVFLLVIFLIFAFLSSTPSSAQSAVIKDMFVVTQHQGSTGTYSKISELTFDSLNPLVERDRLEDCIIQLDIDKIGRQVQRLVNGELNFPLQTSDSTGAIYLSYSGTLFYISREQYNYDFTICNYNTGPDGCSYLKLLEDSIRIYQWKNGIINSDTTFKVDSGIMNEMKFISDRRNGYFYNDSLIYEYTPEEGVFRDSLHFDKPNERIVQVIGSSSPILVADFNTVFISYKDSGQYFLYGKEGLSGEWEDYKKLDSVVFDKNANISYNQYLGNITLSKGLSYNSTKVLRWTPYYSNMKDTIDSGVYNLMDIASNEHFSHLVRWDIPDMDIRDITYAWTNNAKDSLFFTSYLHRGEILGYPLYGKFLGLYIYADFLSGTNDIKDHFKVDAYPNPAHEYLLVSVLGYETYGDMNYEILNRSGQLLDKGLIDAPKNRINISGLSSGIYLLRIRSGHKYSTVKFLKQ